MSSTTIDELIAFNYSTRLAGALHSIIFSKFYVRLHAHHCRPTDGVYRESDCEHHHGISEVPSSIWLDLLLHGRRDDHRGLTKAVLFEHEGFIHQSRVSACYSVSAESINPMRDSSSARKSRITVQADRRFWVRTK